MATDEEPMEAPPPEPPVEPQPLGDPPVPTPTGEVYLQLAPEQQMELTRLVNPTFPLSTPDDLNTFVQRARLLLASMASTSHEQGMNFVGQLQGSYEDLRQRAVELGGENERLNGWVDRLISDPGTPNPRRREKVPDPEKFSGNGGTGKFDAWMSGMSIKFNIDHDRFTNEDHKLAYLYGHLDGSAKQLLRPYFQIDGVIKLRDTKEAFALLKQHYEDPDRLKTAEFEIRKLRQKDGTFSAYLANFTRLAAELEWNDQAKLSQIREGLSNELKTALVYREVPDGYDDFIALCMKQDNQIRMHQLEKSRRFPRGLPTPTVVPSSSSGPEPMDLSATNTQSTPRGPLSTQERLRRVEKGLCLYCGNSGHLIRECTLAPKRPSVSGASTTTTVSSPSASVSALPKNV